ncbi:MAG: peptide deformylase [Bacilli bacterium]
MKLFNIFTDKDSVLHQKAKGVSLPLTKEKREVILDMVEYLKVSQDDELAEKYHIRSGVGIAAPQIGISERFFAIYFDDGDKHYEYGLVNPVILSSSIKKAYLKSGEGCLSVPENVEGYVYRYFRITIKAYDAVSQSEVTLRLSGYPAIVFQHEYDHLDGVLYYDRINKEKPFIEDENAVGIE